MKYVFELMQTHVYQLEVDLDEIPQNKDELMKLWRQQNKEDDMADNVMEITEKVRLLP